MLTRRRRGDVDVEASQAEALGSTQSYLRA
jgi:hypothetical protein